jgi:hypothetical protein
MNRADDRLGHQQRDRRGGPGVEAEMARSALRSALRSADRTFPLSGGWTVKRVQHHERGRTSLDEPAGRPVDRSSWHRRPPWSTACSPVTPSGLVDVSWRQAPAFTVPGYFEIRETPTERIAELPVAGEGIHAGAHDRDARLGHC